VSETTVRRDIAASKGLLLCLGGYVVRGPLTFNATSTTNLKQTAVSETLRSVVKHLVDGKTVFLTVVSSWQCWPVRFPAKRA
jgi:hypothetical protein